MIDEVVLRNLRSMSEFRHLLEIQSQSWGMSYGEATSPYIMAVACHNGGVVIGAEIGEELVGFCFGFPVKRENQWFHWSHMTGVIPAFRGQGIGFKLKQAQRQWAIENGYTVMTWTFDPMQRGNANFNFHQLGTICNQYIVNHYGEMTDRINAGLASDRLEVIWHLSDERVLTLADNPPKSLNANDHDFKESTFLLHQNNLGEIIRTETVLDQETFYIEIPYSVNDLKHDNFVQAQHWQLEVRWALQQAFKQNFIVVDFVTSGKRGWYVLQKHN